MKEINCEAETSARPPPIIMKYTVLFALLAACSAFDKESMLKHNKISNEPAGIVSITSTCDECQKLVNRFKEAAEDPKKLAELKLLLNVFCHETSYVDECRMFVSRLDVIIKKLEPYLEDAHHVCKSFHMCSNSRLEAFHRIGLLYAKKAMNEVDGMNDFVCDECQFAARELKIIVEDKNKQKEIRDFLSRNLCLYLKRYQGMCDELIEQFLPEVFQELDSLLKDPRQACSDVGFCPHLSAPRKLNSMAAAIQALACDFILPSNFTASCNDFLTFYLPTVLYMTYEQFTPEGICTKIKSCDSISRE
ncbi:surfactant protein B [Dictyocaulus viviparus]|uniref:Surfactant protein B n=1 Tax=Dictyocaulus viviparus TaxID=29172 RepID=A0A0D8Y5M5_DICVI|nr:surfactant protein B [Dictyocaulus viviparus]